MSELFKGHKLYRNGTDSSGEVDVEECLKDKIVGLYFSASWCGPCVYFTEDLKNFYERVVNQNDPFEIVYVTLDEKEDEFNEYLKAHGNWLYLKYGDPFVKELKEKYDTLTTGIPQLFIIKSNGEVVDEDGRWRIQPIKIIKRWREPCEIKDDEEPCDIEDDDD